MPELSVTMLLKSMSNLRHFLKTVSEMIQLYRVRFRLTWNSRSSPCSNDSVSVSVCDHGFCHRFGTGSWRASKAESLTLQFSMPLGKQIECRARQGALRRFAR